MGSHAELFDWHGWTLTHDSLVLEAGGGEVYLRPTDLIVAVDETGIEDLSDPNHPVFGLGGCATYVGQYVDVILRPWLRMKKQHFGSIDYPLHAADLREARPEQLSAIGQFFRENHFFRLAALVTSQTNADAPLSTYEAVANLFMYHLNQVARVAPCQRIAMLFEASKRGDRLAKQTFERFRMFAYEGDGRQEVKMLFFRASKTLRHPGLEVADFIMHAAGAAVRERIAGGRELLARRDFQAVFGSVPDYLTQFMYLNSYELRAQSGETKPSPVEV